MTDMTTDQQHYLATLDQDWRARFSAAYDQAYNYHLTLTNDADVAAQRAEAQATKAAPYPNGQPETPTVAKPKAPLLVKIVMAGFLIYFAYIAVLIATHNYDRLGVLIAHAILTAVVFAIATPALFLALKLVLWPLGEIFDFDGEMIAASITGVAWVVGQVVWQIWLNFYA